MNEFEHNAKSWKRFVDDCPPFNEYGKTYLQKVVLNDDQKDQLWYLSSEEDVSTDSDMFLKMIRDWYQHICVRGQSYRGELFSSTEQGFKYVVFLEHPYNVSIKLTQADHCAVRKITQFYNCRKSFVALRWLLYDLHYQLVCRQVIFSSVVRPERM